jgi:hypothetical protein
MSIYWKVPHIRRFQQMWGFRTGITLKPPRRTGCPVQVLFVGGSFPSCSGHRGPTNILPLESNALPPVGSYAGTTDWRKENQMKPRTLCLIAVAFALVFSFARAHAQSSQPPTLRVSVPFDFHIGTKQLPAGDYRVITAYNPTRATILGLDGGAIVVGQYDFNPNDIQQEQARLVFIRVDNQYFLTQIVRPVLQYGLSVPLPKQIQMQAQTGKGNQETIVSER